METSEERRSTVVDMTGFVDGKKVSIFSTIFGNFGKICEKMPKSTIKIIRLTANQFNVLYSYQ